MRLLVIAQGGRHGGFAQIALRHYTHDLSLFQHWEVPELFGRHALFDSPQVVIAIDDLDVLRHHLTYLHVLSSSVMGLRKHCRSVAFPWSKTHASSQRAWDTSSTGGLTPESAGSALESLTCF